MHLGVDSPAKYADRRYILSSAQYIEKWARSGSQINQIPSVDGAQENLPREVRSRWHSWLIAVATLSYLVALVTLGLATNPSLVLLSAVPVALVGTLYGLRRVVVFFLVLAAATIVALEVVGPGLAETMGIYRGIPLLVLFMIGLVTGRLHDLNAELDRQLHESRVIETELRAAQNELRESLAAKDELVASLGHELRTPLTSVLGFAELLRIGAESQIDPSDRHEMASIIAKEAFGLSSTIDDLLVAARIEIGTLEIARFPTAMRAQVSQVIENWGHLDMSGLAISGDAVAIGDPARVRQIVRNLLSNALRHGGSRIQIDISTTEDQAILELSDDGVGLAPDQWEQIFEPYYRLHTEKTQPGSVGLGLTVCRGLAKLMDGTLDYRYSDGKSTFTLRLPLARQGI